MYASDYRKLGMHALNGHWGKAILVSLIAGAAGGGVSFGFSGNGFTTLFKETYKGETQEIIGSIRDLQIPPGVWTLLGSVVLGAVLLGIAVSLALTVLSSVLSLGNADFYTRLAGGSNPPFTRLFAYFKHVWRAFGMHMLISLFVFLWSLLFIVPGIVAAYRYALAPYLMAEDPSLSPMGAINESKRLMDGHKGRLFCLHFSFIGWSLLAMLTCGIGYIWLVPYMNAAEAAFYLDRTDRIRVEAA